METTFTDLSDVKIGSKKKPLYKEMIYRLSVHGALDFYESHSYAMKIGWAVVIILAVVFATYEITMTINTYIESPILTTYAVVPKDQLDFSNVYICPMNVLDAERLDSRVIRIKNFVKFFGMSKGIDHEHVVLTKINRNYDAIQISKKKSWKFRSGRPKQMTIMDQFREMSMDLTDLFKECAFHRRPVSCTNIIRSVFDGDYGQCFLIDVNVTQEVPGYGLSLALDVHRDKYHPQLMPPFDGAYVTITKKYHPGGTSGGVLVRPGGWTKISLHPRQYKLINVDTGKVKQDCVQDLKSIPYKILNHDNYSVASCKLDCAQRVSLKNCSCIAPMDLTYLKPEYHKKTCNFNRLKSCFYDVVMKHAMEEIWNCSQHCVTPCNYWEYSQTISSIDFSNVNNQKHGKRKCAPLNNEDPLNRFNDSRWCFDTIVLDINFPDLKYIEIIQTESMTLDTFLGNIGGQVGLWMGISVISVIQMLVLLICWLRESCNKRKTRKK